MQSKNTPEGRTVKVSLREDELAKEKIYAVLDEFEKLFPESLPVLVACHRASKKPVAPWKGLTQDNWAEPENLGLLARQILMGGNLAIKPGSCSQNLVPIDLDRDDWIEPFLRTNPPFRNTFRTFGSRGGQFWFYATDDYPQEVRKLEINGSAKNAGEFRGGKCISVIWGMHENGNAYTWVNDVPPIKFAFGDIQWPTGWKFTRNNLSFSGKDSRVREVPLSTKYKGRRIDWDKFNEALKNG